MSDLDKIWNEAEAQLVDALPEAKRIYIDMIEYKGEKDGSIVLAFPSDFYKNNAEKNCRSEIENTISVIAGHHIDTVFITDENSTKKKEHKSKPRTQPKPKTENVSKNTTLNKIYSFDNFISGDNSSFAFNAARVIAQNPGTSYNPCLIYGGVGLGKTHLLQSIGNYIDEHNPKMKIIYVTAENFTNEFINSLLTDKASAFKIKYRSVDVLLIDDIHFLQKKNQIQEELFHTFNELYDNHKQIVLTCDRPITELTDITDRLKTRFRKGLNVDLQPPAYETRMAIAIQKCRERNYKLDNNVLEGKPITLDIAKEHLKNFIVEPAIKNNDISIDMIIRKTASYFNIKEYDIKGKSRNKNIILARHISIYLSSKLTSYSLSEIGKMMNGKDHTTIMHSVDRIKSLIDTDESVRNAVNSIESSLME